MSPVEGGSREVTNPSTARPVRCVAEAGEADADRAVAAAERGVAAWSGLSPFDRSRVLRRVAAGIDSNAETFALLESLDVGKPLDMARAEVAEAVECFEYYDRSLCRSKGRSLLRGGAGIVRRETVGRRVITRSTPVTLRRS